jgi:hypothetical protein
MKEMVSLVKGFEYVVSMPSDFFPFKPRPTSKSSPGC